MRFLRDQDYLDKNIALRLDLNVPIKNGLVADATRIDACIPTIEKLLSANCKILIISHLGRPTEGTFDKESSLEPVAKYLSNLLKLEVPLCREISLEECFKDPYQIVMLENIRCFAGEMSNELSLSKKIASICDIYVFDAFGTAHRAQSSTYGAIIESNVSCAGLLVEKEVLSLSRAFKSFDAPLVSVVGGSKVSTKLSVLKKLSEISDQIIVGGGIANTFLLAKGFNVGRSLVETDMLEMAKSILKKGNCILPTEVFTAKSLNDHDATKKSIDSIEDDDLILDINVDSSYKKILDTANTIIWNGPAGVFEKEGFKNGTKNLSSFIASSNAFSIAGGGETIAAINEFIDPIDIGYISTAGGAFLEFLEGKKLPALEALGYDF
ncbi:MAG: phosphoglycerate kinase [Gammaproteobacteria bacterium]|jgi:phosphoglycerate kinase